MAGESWNEARLQRLITERMLESATLEYKRADALGKDDPSKNEISKDVSAFANAEEE